MLAAVASVGTLAAAQVANSSQRKDQPTSSARAEGGGDQDRIEEMGLSPGVLEQALRGKPRKVPDVLKTRPPLLYEPATRQEETLFNRLRRVRNAEKPTADDLRVIEKVTKEQVYSLSDIRRRGGLNQLLKRSQAIGQVLDNPNIVNQEFFSIYEKQLIKYLPDLLDHHLWVRVHAMLLLVKIGDEELIPLYVEQIRDPAQHEAVKYLAIKGIMFAGRTLEARRKFELLRKIADLGEQGIRSVELESQAIEALLELLGKNKPVQSITRWEIVQALSSIGQPRRSAIRTDAEVSLALVQFLRDGEVSRLYRLSAVEGLARMKIPPDWDYNFQCVAYEIAGFASDTVTAAIQSSVQGNLPTDFMVADFLRTGFFVSECYFALNTLTVRAGQHGIAASQGDAGYVGEVRDRLKSLGADTLSIYKQVSGEERRPRELRQKLEFIIQRLQDGSLTAQLTAFNEYLVENPPRSYRLTPDTPALDPLPLLAREVPGNDQKPPGKPEASGH